MTSMRLRQGVFEPVNVVAAIIEQPLGFRQIVQRSCSAGVIADLPSGHEEAERAAVGSPRRHWCGRCCARIPCSCGIAFMAGKVFAD